MKGEKKIAAIFQVGLERCVRFMYFRNGGAGAGAGPKVKVKKWYRYHFRPFSESGRRRLENRPPVEHTTRG